MSKVISVLENNVMSMTSTEIADLTGKEKKNIHADIKIQLLNGLYGISEEKMAVLTTINNIKGLEIVLDNRGYWKEVILDKRHTMAVVSGYNIKLRMAIIDRWQFLEDENLRLKENEKVRLTQRNEARVGYYPMLDALVEARAIEGKDTELTHFMKEANLLNRIVLGKTSRQYRLENKIPTLRDYLPKNKISAINDLQLANMVLINLNFNYEDRKTLLDKRFKEKWISLVEEDILILLE